MSAAGIASGAAGDMAGVVAHAHQVAQVLQQLAAVRAQATEKAEQAKSKLASATQIVTGGTGLGQQLQVKVGQSMVKIGVLQTRLAAAVETADDVAAHAAALEEEIRAWAAGLTK